MNVPARLILSDLLWQRTLSLLQQYTAKKLEAGCFWYGIRTQDTASAVVLGVPRQINRRTNFEIPAQDLATLIEAACDPAGLVAVAQIHIHPGADVRHSPWDDKQVVSRNIYSLVIPNYCRPPIAFESIGVHRFENNGWNMLSPTAAREAICITASFVDTR